MEHSYPQNPATHSLIPPKRFPKKTPLSGSLIPGRPTGSPDRRAPPRHRRAAAARGRGPRGRRGAQAGSPLNTVLDPPSGAGFYGNQKKLQEEGGYPRPPRLPKMILPPGHRSPCMGRDA